MGSLQVHEQKSWLYSLIEVLSKENLGSESGTPQRNIGVENKSFKGAAALIAAFVKTNADLQASLVDWLVGVSANAIGHTHTMHRLVIAVIVQITGE